MSVFPGLLRRLRRLRNCERGAGAVEFAMVVPSLVLGVVGSIELLTMLFLGSLLESAVLDASRYGITGADDGSTARLARIRTVLGERTSGLIDVDKAIINTLVYPTFASIGQPEPYDDANTNGSYDSGETFTDVNGNGQWDADMGAVGLGGPSDIVLYKIEYPRRSMTGLLDPILGEMKLEAAVAVRNEPF